MQGWVEGRGHEASPAWTWPLQLLLHAQSSLSAQQGPGSHCQLVPAPSDHLGHRLLRPRVSSCSR